MLIKDTIMELLLKQPFYGYIAASVTPYENNDIPSLQMEMTPSPRLLYNKDWYQNLSNEHALGVVIHELLHLMLLHPYRKGNRERILWAISCDMAVNEHIDTALIPQDYITVDKIADEIKEILPRMKGAEEYYDILIKSDENISFTASDKEIKIILKSGKELKANNYTEGDSSEVNKNAVKSILSEILKQAKDEGEIPNGLSSFIGEIYYSSEVDWRNVLKRFLSGKGKIKKHKTCKRESRRFENMPGNIRSRGINVLLAIDESGSLCDKYIGKFYHELMSINKITGACINVTQFDTECTSPVPLIKYIKKHERTKGGGTDFRPVFEMADKLRVPLLIIFTDGDGTAPEDSNQKVLWVLTKDGKKPAKFGHSILLKE